MSSYRLDELLVQQDSSGRPYLEFIRQPTMSVGLYVLPAGGIDEQQQPHAEDEVYVVVAGQGRFTSGTETRDVRPGDTIFVPAASPHHFHDISEELRLIVVFSPPESYGRAD